MNRAEREFRNRQIKAANQREADSAPSVRLNQRRARSERVGGAKGRVAMLSISQHNRKLAFYAKHPNLPK